MIQIEPLQPVEETYPTGQQARELGLPLKNLEDVNAIDLLVDGADETTRQFAGIKGGGGA
ncbi:ribose-5-phosphate isomerase A, partial [Facklamia hominis]|uniref:ribose-5-phosphate isomerase A n=1 Tax=Facklamia hominis TaxID=178214 RepID=UPI003BF5464B